MLAYAITDHQMVGHGKEAKRGQRHGGYASTHLRQCLYFGAYRHASEQPFQMALGASIRIKAGIGRRASIPDISAYNRFYKSQYVVQGSFMAGVFHHEGGLCSRKANHVTGSGRWENRAFRHGSGDLLRMAADGIFL